MRKNFGSNSWLYPMPVLIIATYDEQERPNAMNAAWGGIFTDEMIGICLSERHKTTQNILSTRAFTVSMATAEQVVACDYVGLESGNRVPDKFAKAGFHATRSEFVNAPLIDELPMALECELVSYDKESCHLVGKIVNIQRMKVCSRRVKLTRVNCVQSRLTRLITPTSNWALKLTTPSAAASS